MATAIISDIHSNIEALDAVLKDIEGRGIKEIVCLGDLIGYGPNPEEVVERAMGWKIVLMGNHDEAVIKFACGFNPVARAAVTWTREQLEPGFFSGRAKKERWKFLNNLAMSHKDNGVLYVHGSPRDPTMEYIFKSDTIDLTGEVPDKIREIFGMFDRLCLVGHTHEPGIITEDSIFLTPLEFQNTYTFEENRKYIVNVGSVGQPRDGDTRASYAVLDGNAIEYCRIEYDIAAVKEKILKNDQLDKRSAERLSLGK